MSLWSKLQDFILKRMLVTYLSLIPTFILAIISLSFLSIGIFTIQMILIIIGTYLMFKQYEKEKASEKVSKEERFTKKLSVFLQEFKGRIANSSYVYSLVNIALMIATNDLIQKRTKAWTFYLHSLLDMLDKNTNLLDEKLKKGTTFSIAFEDFRNLLFSFRKFRDAFYSMVEETKQDKDFSQDTIFLKEYKRLYEEYNNYMDRLKNFSDDLRVEFNLELSEDLIEHLKDLNELYKTK